jgi:cytochrome c553
MKVNVHRSEGLKMKILAIMTACLAIGAATVLGADAKENWTKNCASCHGKDGKGDTKAGKKAEVKDLSDAKYQESFTDDKAFTQIKDGLKEDGKEKMKPFGGKLSDDEMKALVAFVRTLKK